MNHTTLLVKLWAEEKTFDSLNAYHERSCPGEGFSDI